MLKCRIFYPPLVQEKFSKIGQSKGDLSPWTLNKKKEKERVRVGRRESSVSLSWHLFQARSYWVSAPVVFSNCSQVLSEVIYRSSSKTFLCSFPHSNLLFRILALCHSRAKGSPVLFLTVFKGSVYVVFAVLFTNPSIFLWSTSQWTLEVQPVQSMISNDTSLMFR